MKAILVDDEPLALHYLEEELLRIGGLDIVGKYRNPRQAWDVIGELKPDVVFLDIEMPEMSGMELAELIIQKYPRTQIVFVTVYDQFAAKAFELSAQDYVLKPIYRERLAKTVARLREHAKLRRMEQRPEPAAGINCFRMLQFARGDRSLFAVRWKTSKAQELFLYLLHFRGKSVRKQMLLEQLWPDIEWKKGITQLYTAIYQIRKLVQEEGLGIDIVNADEGYRLELGAMTLDVEEWEKQVKAAPHLSAETLPLHLQLSQRYEGDYLAEYPYWWAEGEKQRLRRIWLQHAKELGDFYRLHGRDADAVSHYVHMQTIVPIEESSYFELMQLYVRLGDRFSAEKQYELLRQMLRRQFDADPQPHVQSWFNEWKLMQ